MTLVQLDHNGNNGKPRSRAWYAVAGFGTLGLGATTVYLAFGWQWAVAWIVLVLVFAVLSIFRMRRATQRLRLEDPASGESGNHV